MIRGDLWYILGSPSHSPSCAVSTTRRQITLGASSNCMQRVSKCRPFSVLRPAIYASLTSWRGLDTLGWDVARGNDFVSFLPSYPGTETKERFFDYDLVTKAEISRLPYDSNCTGASASEERERPLPLRRSLLHFGLFHCPPPCSFSDDIPCLPGRVVARIIRRDGAAG